MYDDDGDGLVTKKGAESCLAWDGSQKQHFEAHPFKLSHFEGTPMMLEFIAGVIGIPIDIHDQTRHVIAEADQRDEL